MEKYLYQICQTGLLLRADRAMKIQEAAPLFLADAAVSALTVECRSAAEPPKVDGTICGKQEEKSVWRAGSKVFRCSAKWPGAPIYACVSYDLGKPSHAALTVDERDWLWATDHMRLWTTLCLPQLLLPFRALIFHASYIGYHGRAILFTAPSGTGKSTQAELWRVHRGAQVINGDKAGVTLREQPMAHGVPFSGTSGICENVSLPLEAVVVLSQAPENTVRRLGPSEAAAALCPNLFVDQAIPEEWSMALHLLLDLVASVPVYALACTPDRRAVETLEQALSQTRAAKPDKGDTL